MDLNRMFAPSNQMIAQQRYMDEAINNSKPQGIYRVPITEEQLFRNSASPEINLNRGRVFQETIQPVQVDRHPTSTQLIDDLVRDLKISGKGHHIVEKMGESRTPAQAMLPLAVVCRHKQVHLPTVYENDELFRSFVDLVRARAVGGLGFEDRKNVIIIIPPEYFTGNNEIRSSQNNPTYHMIPVVKHYRPNEVNAALANNRHHKSLRDLWNNVCSHSMQREQEFLSRIKTNNINYQMPAIVECGNLNFI